MLEFCPLYIVLSKVLFLLLIIKVECYLIGLSKYSACIILDGCMLFSRRFITFVGWCTCSRLIVWFMSIGIDWLMSIIFGCPWFTVLELAVYRLLSTTSGFSMLIVGLSKFISYSMVIIDFFFWGTSFLGLGGKRGLNGTKTFTFGSTKLMSCLFTAVDLDWEWRGSILGVWFYFFSFSILG